MLNRDYVRTEPNGNHRLIQGEDDRIDIDAAVYDYHFGSGNNFDDMIVRIESSLGYGTGALISPKHVLTNAHVIYNDGFASNYSMNVGQEGSYKPYGSIGWENAYVYDINHSFSTDVAIIELSQEIGWATGWFQVSGGNAVDQLFSGSVLHTAGYPYDFGNGNMVYTNDTADGIVFGENILTFDELDSASGQSGSPMWTVDESGEVLTIEALLSGSITEYGGGWERDYWWETPWWNSQQYVSEGYAAATNIDDQIADWITGVIEQDYFWWGA